MKVFSLFCLLLVTLLACTKKQGKNPALAYNDFALLDSCKQAYHSYYKSDPSTLLSGAHGPHGTFKLRFNATAWKMLTDKGTLPLGSSFPDGSLVIKDIYKGSTLDLYALMYKRSGTWLWAEIKPDGNVLHGVADAESVCKGCHSQPGNRDLVVSFDFY